MHPWYAAPVLMLALGAIKAAQPELVMLATTSQTMPYASFVDGELSGGILKDIGENLGQRIGYKVRFQTVPGMRVAMALTHGEADGICFVVPGWIDGKFNWTRPLIPAASVIAANTSAAVAPSLQALAGERIGTVLGYRYPEIEAVLGPNMRRDNAPTVMHSLAKLAAGRSQYAVVDQLTMEYYLRRNPAAPLRMDYTYYRYKASCAFSLASRVKFADVEKAMRAMADDGTIDLIISRYW